MSTSAFSSAVQQRLAEKKGYKKPSAPVEDTTPEPMFEEETNFEFNKGSTKFSDKFFNPAPLPDFSFDIYQDSDWDEDDRIFIPKLDKFHIWPRETYQVMLAYVRNLKVLMFGPTGSGKTSLMKNLAAIVRQPYLRINGRVDMESDSLIGKPWVINGSMEWIDGELVNAIRKGWMIAFDEPWKTPPGIQMTLQRYYERDGILQIDDKPGTLKDKQVYSHERTRMFLCDNVIGTGDSMDKYGATMIQDSSTLNRMDLIIKLGYLEPDKEVNMITSKFKGIPESKAKCIVQIANLIRTGFEQGEYSVTLSPRQINTWCETALLLKDYETAFKFTMLERFADTAERSSVENNYFTCFGKKLI